MFMDKNDWSDDELEDVGDTLVVPISMVPTPQVLSRGGVGSDRELSEDSGFRASAYNERMARARNATMSSRKMSGGMVQANSDNRPVSSRPTTATLTVQQAPPIDTLAQEVEEMEMDEQQQVRRTAALQEQNRFNEQREAPAVQYTQAAATYAAPIDIGDDAPPPQASHRAQYHTGSDSSPDERHRPTDDDSPPSSSSRQAPTQALATIQRPLEAVAPAVIDTSDLRSFLMRPGPQGAMVQCYIQRRKSGLARLYPTYEVYLKDGEQFLLAARRRKKQKQSNYKVSLDREDLSRHSSNFYGKLKSNFMGTEFNMYDSGLNPEKLTPEQRDGSGSQVRQELATVLYKQNVLGSRGPRKMKVIVPNVDEQGNRAVLRPTTLEDTMLERYKAGKESDNVQVLKNKQPKWNDQVGAYVLNFNGRVTRASVKNFQLCNVARDPDLVVMQFGRVGKDAFTMDYQWPLCGLQAFGIALSSFDYKIACE